MRLKRVEANEHGVGKIVHVRCATGRPALLFLRTRAVEVNASHAVTDFITRAPPRDAAGFLCDCSSTDKGYVR